ncbi:hypothetical protein HK097_009446 [Rhizophlyctis rosea]|uniref:Uncharacterized protein n=1 Tax=Rhizophlyctis rosea TaxID=64517 RepID=A0AAD5SC02_9FUNG|nr:hypothetical protein HK097_009446 [Rhizophlyctis rosea]
MSSKLIQKPLLASLRSRSLLTPPLLTRSYASPSSNPTPPPAKPNNDYLYNPEKDPMRNMTEAEKDEIRRDVRRESQRAFSYGYGILGGGIGLALVIIGYNWTSKRH